jgi:hypothetical protein
MEPTIMIAIHAHAIVASNNFAKDEGKQELGISVTMDLLSEPKDLFTVLGNILSGTIRTSVGLLGPTWNPLNLQDTNL